MPKKEIDLNDTAISPDQVGRAGGGRNIFSNDISEAVNQIKAVMSARKLDTVYFPRNTVIALFGYNGKKDAKETSITWTLNKRIKPLGLKAITGTVRDSGEKVIGFTRLE